MMVTLTVQTCVHRLNRPLNFLKTIFPELQWLHLGLTMLQDTRKELRMHSQLETCPSFQSFGSQASAKLWCSSKWGTTRFLLHRQPSQNAWSIQRNEGYPRGTRLQRGSQFTS